MTPRSAHTKSFTCELALGTPYSQTRSPSGQGCAAPWERVEAGALEKSGGILPTKAVLSPEWDDVRRSGLL